MIRLPQVSGASYGVVGLGKSGRGTVASLLASDAQVYAWDDSEKGRIALAAEFPAATIAPVAMWDFTALDALVMSPGIPLSHDAVLRAKAQGVEVIGDIELLWRAQPEATYIAITGTNGKSTTTSLIAHILKECGKQVEVGGNLGIPALALAPLGAGGIYVLELSSYQLDLIATTRFNAAILLNISPDHLDHHGSMAAYIEAKCHIFDRQQKGDVAIVGIDDADSRSIAQRLQGAMARVIPISAAGTVAQGVAIRNAEIRDGAFSGEDAPQGSIAAVRSLQGQHNWQNAAAAYAACMYVLADAPRVLAAMATYPGLAHRMQWLGEVAGVQFVNDSKATNADAAEKALRTYDAIHWILGGVAKEGGIEPLAPYFTKVRHAYLIGEAADTFARVLEGHVPYTQCATLENAFHEAAKAATAEAQETAATRSVVLAPACASFDQFANFEVRGDAFAALYRQWAERPQA